jgi:hypothetical protein
MIAFSVVLMIIIVPFDAIEYSYMQLVEALGYKIGHGRSRVRFSMRSLDFFNLPIPSSRTMALGSTQSLT